jgi:hypothetical protein
MYPFQQKSCRNTKLLKNNFGLLCVEKTNKFQALEVPLPGRLGRGLLNWINRIAFFCMQFDYLRISRTSPLKNLYN